MNSVLIVSLLASFTIVRPPSPKPWESSAAGELRTYLDRVTLGDVTVDGNEDVVFHVGDTKLAVEKGLSSATFKDEEWVVRSFGKDVVLNGGGTRGALYSVYRFLEDFCDVRWWSDDEEDVPLRTPLALSALDCSGRPFFMMRDTHRGTRFDKRTAVRNRQNGNCAGEIPADLGGSFGFGPPNFCHTWDMLLPFSKYGKEHPEWFSLVNGKRVGGQRTGQLCLSNPEVPVALAARVEEMIKKGLARAKQMGIPAPRIYDVSMNDNKHYCQCGSCKSIRAIHGHSGEQLLMENKVAEIVGKKYPEVLVNVFAYYEGEEPPKSDVRPASNVCVRLCNTHQNCAAGIFEPGNKFMHDRVVEWAKISSHLAVWDYTRLFETTTLGFPYASEFYIGERIRFYAEHGVQSLFMQHDNPDTDLWEIKYQLITKFLEDPKRDSERLIVDTFRQYFGKAGDVILAMRRKLDRWRRDRDAFVGWFAMFGEFAFVRTDEIREMVRVWDEAERLVAGDEKYLRRVKRARRGTDRFLASRLLQESLRHAPEPGVSDVVFVNCPADMKTYSNKYSAKIGLELVDDPEASTGKAFRLRWKDTPHFGPPFAMGFFDHTHMQTIAVKSFPTSTDGKYHWYDMGEVFLPRVSYYFFMTRGWNIQVTPDVPGCPEGKVRPKACVKYDDEYLWLDRVIFQPADIGAGGDK